MQTQPISRNSSITVTEISEKSNITNLIASTAQSKICATCNKSPVKSFCGRCKVVNYCGSECQKKDWQKHKEICLPATSLNPKKEIKRTVKGLEYDPLLESVINKILNSKPTLDLLEKVLMDGPLNIQIGEAPKGGKWEPVKRCITISSSESDSRKLGHITFEIANAIHAKTQITLAKDALKGLVSREQYAEKWEKIEYSALTVVVPIIKASIDEYQWPRESFLDLDQLLKICDTWDKFWKFISQTSHSELFRVEWDQSYRSSYEKK